MALRIENDLANNNSQPSSVKPQVQPEKTPVTVPVGQTEETKPDIDKPIKGLSVEKTSVEPLKNKQDEEEIDTSINTEPIIVNPSIAIYKETEGITNGMKEDLKRVNANSFQSSGEDAYYRASNMIKDKQPYNCFDELKFKNRINVFGKATYERNDSKYNMNVGSEVKTYDNSAKVDFGITYKSKSEKTKAMLFTSLTKTNSIMKIKTIPSVPTDAEPEENPDIEPDDQQPLSENMEPEDSLATDPVDPQTNQEEVRPYISRIQSNNTLFCLSGAYRQQFNKDFLTVSADLTNDTRYNSNTVNAGAGYYYGRFGTLVQGELNSYKLVNQKAITELDFNISLNPELANSNQKENENNTSAQEAETPTEEVVTPKSGKKWSTAFSPVYKSETTDGKTTQGLEGQVRFKRVGDDSTLRIGTYAGFSTTQQDKQYHASSGVMLRYSKNFSSDKQFNAKVALKDRYTFGNVGNILTVDGTAAYTSPKLTAEVEGKYMNITHPNSPNYVGLVGRVFYTPKKYLNIFFEGSYAKIKYPDYEVGGSNVQVGAMVNF